MNTWKISYHNFMLNGMESVDITYNTIERLPDRDTFNKILNLYSEIFDDADPEFFETRFNQQPDLVSVLAYNGSHLVGFKIGYRYSSSTFYSWIGGVKHPFRNHGIATTLAIKQEEMAKWKKYAKLRTKSMNQYKAMLLLNIKRGFQITQVYTNQSGQTKIVFEKKL